MVDTYAKIESERLNWICNNQKKLRTEEYIHLDDAMLRTDGQLSELGKIVLLPSFCTGGFSYMHEQTHDAMTYVVITDGQIYLLHLLAILNGKK